MKVEADKRSNLSVPDMGPVWYRCFASGGVALSLPEWYICYYWWNGLLPTEIVPWTVLGHQGVGIYQLRIEVKDILEITLAPTRGAMVRGHRTRRIPWVRYA